MPFFHIFSSFTNQVETLITQGGYIFLFLVTTLEGLPLIGVALPGHITIIIGGFLAKIGILNLTWVVIVSLIGAIIGDYLGFFIGRKYGLSFIDRVRPYFFITDNHITKANNLLAKHTGKALIIGRFSPLTRALLPFLVGASQTTTKKFWFYNTVGGTLWVVSSILIGYIFGSGYHVAVGYLGKFALFAIIAALLILWGYRFVNTRFHIFRRYELFMLIFNLTSLYVLARTLQDAWLPRSFIANFDIYINNYMDIINHQYLNLTTIFTLITNLGNTKIMLGLSIILVGIFVIKKKIRRASIVILGVGSTGFLIGVMKTFFMRPRPENALLHVINDPSFPSGHAAMSAAFFVVLAYILAPHIKSWIKREMMIVCCVLAFIAIGFSRVFLNVHWASDVIAGWALGIFCVSSSVLIVRYVGALVVDKGDKIKKVMNSDIFQNYK